MKNTATKSTPPKVNSVKRKLVGESPNTGQKPQKAQIIEQQMAEIPTDSINDTVMINATEENASAMLHEVEHLDENQMEITSHTAPFVLAPKKGKFKPITTDLLQKLNNMVYMKGVSCNIVKTLAVAKADEFTSCMNSYCGELDKIEVVKDSLRLTCTSQDQKEKLMELTNILDLEVRVTLPFSIMKSYNSNENIAELTTKTKSATWKKGVIKTPIDMDIETIKNYSGAIWAHRITTKINEHIKETPSVIIAFEETLPERVKIGFFAFKVDQYIPKPIRCTKCQRFGHKAKDCKKEETCPRCAGPHAYEHCTMEVNALKCINCGGPHSAAYKGCEKFKSVTAALKSTVVEGISYRDALKNQNIQARALKQNNQMTIQKQTAEKSDAATQTECNGETQTENYQNIDETTTNVIKATVDAVNWLLTQITVKSSNKPILEQLKQQYATLSGTFFTECTVKKPDANLQKQSTIPATMIMEKKGLDSIIKSSTTSASGPNKKDESLGAIPKTKQPAQHVGKSMKDASSINSNVEIPKKTQ